MMRENAALVVLPLLQASVTSYFLSINTRCDDVLMLFIHVAQLSRATMLTYHFDVKITVTMLSFPFRISAPLACKLDFKFSLPLMLSG